MNLKYFIFAQLEITNLVTVINIAIQIKFSSTKWKKKITEMEILLSLHANYKTNFLFL